MVAEDGRRGDCQEGSCHPGLSSGVACHRFALQASPSREARPQPPQPHARFQSSAPACAHPDRNPRHTPRHLLLPGLKPTREQWVPRGGGCSAAACLLTTQRWLTVGAVVTFTGLSPVLTKISATALRQTGSESRTQKWQNNYLTPNSR